MKPQVLTLKQCKPSIILFCWPLLCYYLNHLVQGMCMDQEREALLKFKDGFRVDQCGLLSSWSDHQDNRDCCQWHGVHCSNYTGHVIELNLRGTNIGQGESDNCLHGKVSPSLVDLKHLRFLDLSLNFFDYTPIPSFIGSLSKLEHLDLSHSSFQGVVPPELGNLSQLTFLDLSYMVIDEHDSSMGDDHVYSYLPVGNLSWLSNLILLRHINFGGADLSKATDWLQIVNQLPFLRVLRLDDCQLPSRIPWPISYINSSTTLSYLSLARNDLNDSSIFQWLFNSSGINTHLAHIDLSWNQLQGPLPSSFGNLQALSYLDLSNNYFEGTVPSSFANLESLSYVSLSQNQFQGEIPVFTSKNLTFIDFSSNKFQFWPKTFNPLCSLQELHLQFYNLTEEFPTIIQALSGCANSSLSYLDLSNNQIWGSIPSNIDALSSLSLLDLGGNKLNGTISQSLGQLSTLGLLNLSSNCLKGSLFTSHFSNLSQLYNLDLSNNPELKFEANPQSQLNSIVLRSCKLGPLFPKWLLAQTFYMVLDVSDTGISDRIPESFWNSLPSQLQSLNMSHNNIYGTLPDLHQEYSFEFEIDLSFNSFEGSMPSVFPQTITSFLLNDNKFSDAKFFLCPKNISSLSSLDLSNNLLSGELPDCWMNFSQLNILHLANNNFSGAIPPSIGYLNQLQALHLRNNNFSAEVPRSLNNLTSLVILDLAHNSLSGIIQPTIGNSLESLSYLSLRNNHFVGEIPSSLCQLSFLQILDLSVNHITGTIPKCMYNLTAMKNGTDLLPKLQYNIHNTSDVDINSYSFDYYTDAATIMWKRKEWSFMNSLGLIKEIDMSNNQLHGEIPDAIFSLTGLVSLDLSSNNLSGTITAKFGQLTALEFLDLSSNHLTGEIPRSIADLNSLGILDLSYNHLSGKIPTGSLLQGFDTSAYEGNPNLCGMPLPKCPWDQPPVLNGNNTSYKDDNGSENIYLGLYISVVLGFIIGFWGVCCGSLVLKRSWRHIFFQYFDDLMDKLNVTVARVRRKV